MSLRHALVVAVLLPGPTLIAADLRVPSDYSTIQEAIDAAVGGDRVLVADLLTLLSRWGDCPEIVPG